MSNILVGFLAGAGISAWVYSKMYRSTGGNTGNALIVAGSAGVAAWVIVVVVLGMIFK